MGWLRAEGEAVEGKAGIEGAGEGRVCHGLRAEGVVLSWMCTGRVDIWEVSNLRR